MTASTSHEQAFHENLRKLSDASVERNFQPYRDIDWQALSAEQIDDERFILSPTADPLGAHPWYQALPRERQIEIGAWRYANLAKVGLQFEQVLIGGLVQHLMRLPNFTPEFRYATHEMIEECNHTLMFQEAVNRAGLDVKGSPRWFRAAAPLLMFFGTISPEAFFTGILAGEEPIDHLQKAVLRSGDKMHPTMQRVFQIHIAEEARHISFAHQWLKNRVPKMNRVRRFSLSLTFPVIMRALCDVIMRPSKDFWDRFDIPDEVRKDLFWNSPHAKRTLKAYFADVRALADELALMNPASRQIWKAMGIDGEVSRYRSEPDRAPVSPAA